MGVLARTHTHTQTHKAWPQWCDGKRQARGCKHLSLISYSLWGHLGLGYGKERWFILHDKYEFFVRRIWRSGGGITAQVLFKRYRFSAQLLSFCRVSGSEVALGDIVDTPGWVGPCARGGEKMETAPPGGTVEALCTVSIKGFSAFGIGRESTLHFLFIFYKNICTALMLS